MKYSWSEGLWPTFDGWNNVIPPGNQAVNGEYSAEDKPKPVKHGYEI